MVDGWWTKLGQLLFSLGNKIAIPFSVLGMVCILSGWVGVVRGHHHMEDLTVDSE